MKIKKVIAHPGICHADDIMAVALLSLLNHGAIIERRIPTAEDLADPEVACVDVGGEYDFLKSNYDHHQKGGAGARWDSEIKYASFGLVFDHNHPKDGLVYQYLNDKLVLPIDALDNGQKAPSVNELVSVLEKKMDESKYNPDDYDQGEDDGGQRCLRKGHTAGLKEAIIAVNSYGDIPALSLSAVLSSFNPPGSASPADRDAAFMKAVEFGKIIFQNFVAEAEEWAGARTAVLKADVINHIMVLQKFAPWQDHVFNRPDQDKILYVVFPSERGGYCIQQVPKTPGGFEGRKPLPEAWAGLRGQDLARIIGFCSSGPSLFCHPGRFIGGAENLEDAMKMAHMAVAA